MKIYVYTIPKAGTYFIADFLGRLGFNNTGYHVSRNRILNTHKLDLDTNARTPGKAQEKQIFTKTFNQMADGDVAFGHFPAPLMGWTFPAFTYVCSYRHPRTTLMSEFIDFRFRREDINWISRDTIPDDQEAFRTYLAKHGPVHVSIFSEMLSVSLLLNEELCIRYDPARYRLLNFEKLLKDPDEAGRLAEFVGHTAKEGCAAREASLIAETKTKATDLSIDREALWSPEAEALYEILGAEAYVRRGRELGWDL